MLQLGQIMFKKTWTVSSLGLLAAKPDRDAHNDQVMTYYGLWVNKQGPRSTWTVKTHLPVINGKKEYPLSEATVVHITARSQRADEPSLQRFFQLPANFYVDPRNYVVLPKEAHNLFDAPILVLLPSKSGPAESAAPSAAASSRPPSAAASAATSGPSSAAAAPVDPRLAAVGSGRTTAPAVRLRLLANPPSSVAKPTLRLAKMLNGEFLQFQNEKRPFMRLLGWKALCVLSADPESDRGLGVSDPHSDFDFDYSVDAEGNKALKKACAMWTWP
jgi:hypothetical protein